MNNIDRIYDSTDITPMFPHLVSKITFNGNDARRDYRTNEYVVDWQMPNDTLKR